MLLEDTIIISVYFLLSFTILMESTTKNFEPNNRLKISNAGKANRLSKAKEVS
jgi:hypothetical protein